MATLLTFPEVAAGTSEAVLAEWLVAVGDSFVAGDPIVVIETDKAVVEVEADEDAKLLKALVPGGSEVAVGAPMAVLGSSSETIEDAEMLLKSLGLGDAPQTKPAPQRRDLPDPVAAPTSPTQSRQLISPIARKMLKDAGISADEVEGTGPNGRIIRRDVEKATAARISTPTETPPPSARQPPRVDVEVSAAGYSDVPHSRMRKAIATRLTQSKQEIPHFYVRRTVKIDALMTLRAQVNERAPSRVSVNDLLIRAVAVAHGRVPEANVIWTDDALRHFDQVDISVAIASTRGLVTPVVRDAGRQSVGAISSAVKTFVEKADAGKLQQQDLEGGSISISNLGMFGVDEFSAIINPPQSAILAVGAGRPMPMVLDGELTVATCLELVLSVDHRAIDGALAARWMETLVGVLEQPLTLLV